MLHDFLDVDKSPLLSLSKKGLAKASFAVTIGMISLAAGTGLLPITVAGVSNTQVASAQNITNVPTNASDIQKEAANFWWNYYRRPWTQYYIGNFTPEQTTYINNKWGNQSQAIFNQYCRYSYYDRIGLNWYGRQIAEPFAWFLFPSRQEGNRVNCYYRKFN
jgi:hypothetical protein